MTINVGGQSFKADIDTGNSETWLVGPEFECSLGHGNTIRSECKFGPSYKPTSSFRTLDEVLSIAYGDNDGANGILGLERVTFAGITVEHQRIGVANKTEWKYGDGVSSGVIGLGPPRKSTRNPILRSIFAKNKVSPIFSLAISRDSDENAGFFALGRLPPVQHSSSQASAHFEYPPADDSEDRIPNFKYNHYRIMVKGFAWGSRTPSGFPPGGLAHLGGHSDIPTIAIVDSGSSLMQVPTVVAEGVNAAFYPPAVRYGNGFEFKVPCTALAPTLEVKIGTETFSIDPKDMIFHANKAAADECISGVSDGGPGKFILGDAFLKNVVAVFDIGGQQMQFYARH